MNLAQIAAVLGCKIAESSLPITGVSIDSRKILPGSLFIALRGERFDGHDFMENAIEAGAAAIVCERPNPSIDRTLQLQVQNAEQALADIAAWHQNNVQVPSVAVTGSNGKTSVKEMINSILPKPALATQGNLNNHLGAPLSVLQLQSDHRYAVFELGASHQGEIAFTAAIVKPKVALITNIAPAHIEGFGSIEGVARAKGEIYESLDSQGTVVINEDDHFAHFWDDIVQSKRVLRFSLDKPADVMARKIHYNPAGCASFTLQLPGVTADIALQVPGEHSVSNALAAAAATYALGIAVSDIVKGLNAFQGVPLRMTFREGKNHSLIIDDTYNANLRSVLTGIAVLAKRPGRRILVLGDMGELGSYTQAHHEEVGLKARAQNIDLMLTCGTHSIFSSRAFGAMGNHYVNQEELIQALLPYLDKDTTVLVKGSRSARMEKIVQQLVHSSTNANAANASLGTASSSEQSQLSKLPST